MRKTLQNILLRQSKKLFFVAACLGMAMTTLQAQCNVVDGEISGTIFLDVNTNGVNDDQSYLPTILINAFDEDGQLADQAISNFFGEYTLENLDPTKMYRVEFKHSPDFYSTKLGADHKTEIRYVNGAACNISYGLVDDAILMGDNPNIAVTCFVQGDNPALESMETVVGIESQFFSSPTSSTPAFPILTKQHTGSVWGLAFDIKKQRLYSAAFIKQNAELGPEGMDAIYMTSINDSSFPTTLFTKLSSLGVTINNLNVTDQDDCDYGVQAGKFGLGAIELSDNAKQLYVINIAGKSLVTIDTENPTAATTTEVAIPAHPSYPNATFYPFALSRYNGSLYVGATITGEDSNTSSSTIAYVLKYNPATFEFDVVFTTNYIQGPWKDNTPAGYDVQQWLTDIDFVNDDFMILGISDRKGHRFCNPPTSRLDDQKGDILAVYRDDTGVWNLEKNAMIFGTQVGSGRDNQQGPADLTGAKGEFFGHDYFPEQADYHNEVAIGSMVFLPNTKEIVATTFDPYFNTYSGGLQRYSTSNGELAGFGSTFTGAKELYTKNQNELFGKATGFGEVVILAPNPGLEIGNIVWIDSNKNGIQDANEEILQNVEITLYDENCQVVGTTTTNTDGNYVFNNSNVDLDGDGTFDGLDPDTEYYIVLSDNKFNPVNGAFSHNGELLVVTDVHVGHTANPVGTDNDATIASDVCTTFDGSPFISVTTEQLGNNKYTYDFGLKPSGNFDLALKKEVVGDPFVRVDDMVTFKITVINQGEVHAKDIVITDYIPQGLRNEAGNNNSWNFTGDVATYTIPTLAAQTETEIFINLFINGGFTYDHFINYAEISSANDQFGLPGQDVDSTPDADFTNDEGGVPFQNSDNEVADDGTFDEDDHDPATVKVFDLALTKKLVNVQSTYLQNDQVDFEIYVTNQGNVAAKDIVVTDYVPDGLEIDNSPGWTNNSGRMQYTIPSIGVGERVTVPVSMTIINLEDVVTVVNIAEISSAKTTDDEDAIDIDSTPNDDPSDDKGGNPYDNTDNEIMDGGSIDEDDHDPAIFNLSRFDLALVKTTPSRGVSPGDIVRFDIKVVNQGTIVANDIEIVDYIPEGLEFIDNEGWTLNAQGQAETMLSVSTGMLSPTGLVPGQEVSVSINLRVKNDVEPGQLINVAEISAVRDINGNDRSNDDFDSTPDLSASNDPGGQVDTDHDNSLAGNGIEDEDDQDPAAIVVYQFGFYMGCTCFGNDEVDSEGQFGHKIFVDAPSGERWYVTSADGLEQGNGSASNPTDFSVYPEGEQIHTNPFPTGALSDSLFGNNSSVVGVTEYSLEGISINGQPFTVTLSNGIDEVTISGGTCQYATQSIIGAAGVCAGSTMTYCAEDASLADYNWVLSAGGIITSPADESCVTIEFDAAPGGPFTLELESNDASECVESAIININSGVAGGAMACIGAATVSLNSDCELVVTPDLVLQGDLPDDAVYTVTVIDPAGNMLAEPIITGEYVGQEMTIKAVDVCSGNSCWTAITVFDNLAPVLEVEDVTILCSEMTNVGMPTAVDNCGGPVTIDLVNETAPVMLNCDDDFTATITRTFTATDDQGNVSAEEEQTIFLRRIDVMAVDFPEPRTVLNNNPVFCQQYETDENGNPSTNETGVPTFEGLPLFPFDAAICNVGVDYEDEIVQPNGCVEKIMRTWTVFEWYCGEAIINTFVQEINIADQLAPVFAAPSNVTVTTNTGECLATVTLPVVEPTDDCSTAFEVDIQYPGGFLNNQNGGTIDLPLGESMITYTVYDQCLNSSMQSFSVSVMDNTPPTMVCDQNTVLGLNSDGYAIAPASVFDDGSVEDCSPLTLTVRRMDNGAACGFNGSALGPNVEFCCADVGQTVLVVLRATDEDGNFNECMVNVIVQDKNPPTITVPENLTIQCTTVFDPENLGAFFGLATASDNCQITDIEEIPSININDCNTGTIVRTFIASDGNGTAVGTQIIFVENNSVFGESDIDWPEDFSTDAGCNAGDLQPENLDAPFNFPVITTDECDFVETAFTDQTFQTTDGAGCLKILRRWMVMNMCDLDSEGNPAMFMHEQTIIVTNSVDPVILSSCEPVSSSLNADCDEGDITLFASAEDDCTPDNMLQFSYNIDLGNDGSFDISQNGGGNTISVTGTYPLGTHRIVYQFEDRCGNDAVCTQFFTIFNEVFPIAKCINLNVELTPMDTDGDNILDSEMAFLDVDLLGGDSEHPCDTPFTLSYDVAGDSTVAVFDCFNLGINNVTVYVTDIFGNQSSCVSEVEIQDNNNVDICPSVEDCIMFPDTTLLITECVLDLDPETIMSMTTVSEPCVCENYTIDFTDTDISNPADACRVISRDWEVSFNCFSTPMVFNFVQTITQQNAFAPVISACPADGVGMSTNSACTAFVTLGLPTVEGLGECTTGITITNDSEFADSNTGDASGNYPVGVTTVEYTVTDLCGNASTCDVIVTVDDLGVPICNTQDITISIPASGGAVTIAGDAVDNGSQDDCGTIVNYQVTPNTFTCDDLGDNTVVMTVTDQSGNSSTCTAVVTVEDLVAPICVSQNLSITLFVDGQITIQGSQLDNGSFDTCGTVVSFDVSPDTFDCGDVGDNVVTFTVFDNNGNSSSCPATVTIIDGVDPLCVAQDISITLDANGTYMLDASEVDGGSSDVCGDQISLAVSPNTFDCDDLGDNVVTLTVTDGNGNTSECTATVTVTEDVAPICMAGTANITLFAPANISIPASFVDAGSFDECGEVDTIFITPDVFGCDDIGSNTVILTVIDNSGNSSTCEGTVNVSDNVAPQCVSQDITINIEADGTTMIEGIDVDGGSTDACGSIVSYEVSPNVFTCDDTGDNTVILTVTDDSGNECTTTATVTVVNMDELMCAAQDLTVYLDETGFVQITAEEVDNGTMAPCGSTVTISISETDFFCNDTQSNPNNILFFATDDISGEVDTCFSAITVLDTLVPIVTCPADLTFTCNDDLTDMSIFGDATFVDNCPGGQMMDTVIVTSTNVCGIGTITITYSATDISGNIGSCTQTITIEAAPGGLFSEANIVWPVDTIDVVDCSMTTPEELMSFPTFIDTMGLSCFNLSVDFVDMSIGMGTMCMDTVQRTWTVTDSCQLDGSGAGIFTYDQILIIDDSDIPEIMGIPTDTILFSSADSCNVFVDLSAANVMDCSMNIVVSNDSPFSDNANSLDASGVYPLGTTTVTLSSMDACGNMDEFMINVTIVDTVPPVLVCFKTFPAITDDGTVTITAESIVSSLTDNCTDSLNMNLQFILDFTEDDTDPTDNVLAETLTFDCDDLGINIIYVAVIDESGNFAFCAAATAIEDPDGFCGPAPPTATIEGMISTVYGEAVSSTDITLSGNTNVTVENQSDGSYAFDGVYGLGIFEITPYNNNTPLKGVTTLDILIIQKHIMDMDALTSPYDMIAADVNKSGTITGADIITLQKLILGDITEFPENTSFRFIDRDFEFTSGDPFSVTLPEIAELIGITSNTIQDFYGIKIGDVNGSFEAPFTSGETPPNASVDVDFRTIEHELSMMEGNLIPNDGVVEIPVYSPSFESMQALEMTLSSDGARIVGVKAASLDVTENDYRIQGFGKKLKMSWYNDLAFDVAEGEHLFSILVSSNEAIVASDVISMTQATNEFYSTNYEIAELRFAKAREVQETPQLVLNQNVPNPWTSATSITFDMFKDAPYTINFYNADGKLLSSLNGDGTIGLNTVTVTKKQLGTQSGMIVYELISGNRKQVKRMILIE